MLFYLVFVDFQTQGFFIVLYTRTTLPVPWPPGNHGNVPPLVILVHFCNGVHLAALSMTARSLLIPKSLYKRLYVIPGHTQGCGDFFCAVKQLLSAVNCAHFVAINVRGTRCLDFSWGVHP